MSLGDRIRAIRGNVPQKEFSEDCGVGVSTLRRYESGGNPPDADFLSAMVTKYNVNPVWLLSGEGEVYMSGGIPDGEVLSSRADSGQPSIYMDHNGDVVIPRWQSPDPELFDYIPMAEAQLSAGGGSFVISQDIGDYYAFRKSWLSRVASSTKNLVLMRVAGSSMAPTIENDDTVMIDIGKRSIKEGMVYAIRVEDTVMIKRLSLRLEGKVLVISDNRTEFEPFEADRKSLHIIGQVIFFCRTFMTD